MSYDDMREMEPQLAGYQEDFDVAIANVDITNDFMFAHVMHNKQICIKLLEYLLPGQKIKDVDYYSDKEDDKHGDSAQETTLDTQKNISAEYDKRGVRLDAYLDDGETVYNIEMQTTPEVALPRRARTYQAYMDSHQLMKGTQFDKLKKSYVIFICKFDPFGKDWSRYSFSYRCDDDTTMQLGDEAYKLFFNTSGRGEGLSKPLQELLTYMNDTKSYPVKETDNDLIKEIDHAVLIARQNDEWRRQFMTMQIRDRSAEMRGEERATLRLLTTAMRKRNLTIEEALDEQDFSSEERAKYAFYLRNAKSVPVM